MSEYQLETEALLVLTTSLGTGSRKPLNRRYNIYHLSVQPPFLTLPRAFQSRDHRTLSSETTIELTETRLLVESFVSDQTAWLLQNDILHFCISSVLWCTYCSLLFTAVSQLSVSCATLVSITSSDLTLEKKETYFISYGLQIVRVCRIIYIFCYEIWIRIFNITLK